MSRSNEPISTGPAFPGDHALSGRPQTGIDGSEFDFLAVLEKLKKLA
jgi:hypothetical protein